MHIRPIVIVVILAVAAGASVVRLAFGGSSSSFAVASSTPEPLSARDAGDGRRRSTFETSSDAVGSAASSHARAVVYVAGYVRRPGVYTLAGDARVADALRAAGGRSAGADPTAVDLAARIEDGEEIAVPALGAADAASVPDLSDAAHAPRPRRHARHRRRRKHVRRAPRATVDEARDDASASDAGARSSMVDVNVADAAALATLPGIGPGLAERIVAFRDLNGPFASADELLDVGGVTASKVDRLSSYVTFGARHP